MKSSSLQTIIYATVLGVVCASMLTIAAEFTAPYQKANADAEEKRNVLVVLGVILSDSKASAEELVEVFKKNIVIKKRGDLEISQYVPPGGEIIAVAVPFSGPGLWGRIEGFLALEPDMKTIRGVTFHKQEETPGLGGEIVAPLFTDQFKGKSILDVDGTPGMAIKAGPTTGINEIDAITGASMTCDKVEAMLNEVIAKITAEVSNDGR